MEGRGLQTERGTEESTYPLEVREEGEERLFLLQ